MIFVFGSNLAGKHGRGAALFAMQHYGAIYGQGIGHFGNSYALPTCDQNIQPMSLPRINTYVVDFMNYARRNPELQFEVTRLGCGIAGYTDFDIAPMFKDAPTNCILPSWRNWR